MTVDGKNGIDEAIIYDSRFLGPGAPNDNTKNGFDFDLEHPLMPDDLSVGNLLVMRENSNNQPNDSGQGGTLTFQLDNPMFLESVDVVDHDNKGESSVIRAYQTQDCTGSFVEADIVEFNKERSLQRVFVNANNVSCFEIIYFDSGGFTNIHLTCVQDQKKFNHDDVIAKGVIELPDGYMASDKVTIEFDEPTDVMEAMGIKIKVFKNEIKFGGLSVGDIIVADDNADAIIKVDPVTGEQTIISDDSDFDDPENLLIDSQGRLLVAEGDFPGSSGPGTIFIVNPDGSLSIFTTGGFFADGPEDLVEDEFGNIYVADDSGDANVDGKIIKVTPGGVQSLVAELNYNGGKLEGITLDNSGDIIVVGGTGSGAKVSKIDPVTGDETVISDISDGDKFLRPEGVAVTANGDIIIADGNPSDTNNPDVRGQILRVDPVTGDQFFLSTGAPWVDPSDVEILANGFLIVTDDAAEGMGAVIKVDPSDGSTEIISANGFFDSPEGLFIVSEVQNKCVKERDGEGCTPGYWKANAVNKNANAWPFPTNTLLTDLGVVNTSGFNIAGLTVLDALSLQGGDSLAEKEEILLRTGAGAILSSASVNVDYPLTLAQVIVELNIALASDVISVINVQAGSFDTNNNLFCPLDQQG